MKTWQEEFNDLRKADGGWYGCIVNDGWKKLVLDVDEMLVKIDPNYKICQVKEKFGTLRYYYDTQLEYGTVERKMMDAIVEAAEFRSSITCERCGKYGELRTQRYYVLTLCDACDKERDKEIGKINE